MTGNKGKARSLYFGPKSVNRMLLSTEKKRLLETGKTSPPSFKELLQILGRFVQFGQFYPISDPSVRFCAHPSDFGHFRSILNVFVPFRILLSDFRWLSSDFGYLLPFSDILIRFQTLLLRQMLRDHPIACFRPTQDESVRWFLTHLLEPLKLALFKGNLKFTCVRRRWNSLFVYLPLFQGNFQKYTKPDTLRAFHFYFGPEQSDN